MILNKSFSRFSINNINLNENKFINIQSIDEYDYFNKNINSLTLNLTNKTGKNYNFGIDKLYIESFTEGNYVYNFVGEKYLTTKIKIQNKNDEYKKFINLFYKNNSLNSLNNHNLIEGDLLYFYNNEPSINDILYLENYIKINKLRYNKKENKLNIYLHYIDNINNKETSIDVNLKNDLFDKFNEKYIDYYIVLHNIKSNTYLFLKINSYEKNCIIVDYKSTSKIKDYNNIKIGICKKDSYSLENDENSIFNIHGYKIENINNRNIEDDIYWEFEINYPYNKLPEYLKNTIYKSSEYFLIQDKMQISYTFLVTYLE